VLEPHSKRRLHGWRAVDQQHELLAQQHEVVRGERVVEQHAVGGDDDPGRVKRLRHRGGELAAKRGFFGSRPKRQRQENNCQPRREGRSHVGHCRAGP
jgi:hypothetical protein